MVSNDSDDLFMLKVQYKTSNHLADNTFVLSLILDFLVSK